MIKGYFQRFSNHAFHLLTYSVRSDSPQLFFSGSRELEVTSPTLRRSHSSPAILCRLIWYCIYFRHRSSITCISMFIMFYVFIKIYICDCNKCMIWVWLGIFFENVKWWMRIVVKCIGILESDGYGKIYFILFIIEKAYFGNR